MSITLRLHDFRAAVARGLQKVTGRKTADNAPDVQRDTLVLAHSNGSVNTTAASGVAPHGVAPQAPGALAHQTLQSARQSVKYTFSQTADTPDATTSAFGAALGVASSNSPNTLATCHLNYPLALSKGSAFAFGQADIGDVPPGEPAAQSPAAKHSAERNILAKLREQVGARHINPKALAEYGRALVVFAHSEAEVKQGCEMLQLAAQKAPHNSQIAALLQLIPNAL